MTTVLLFPASTPLQLLDEIRHLTGDKSDPISLDLRRSTRVTSPHQGQRTVPGWCAWLGEARFGAENWAWCRVSTTV